MRNGKIKKDYVEVFGIRKQFFVVTLRDDDICDTQYYPNFAVAQKTVEQFEKGNYTVDKDGNVELNK